ncbi:carbohydrate ABC transporter permease [Streptomyces sp. NPDC093228]|uniref:carbohydrate ABC transporter permease n=1 Tax=unclassified Streptomyces TaxID=2593676 RepID=UPI0007413743|nr:MULTISPECIES: carbohydrate ABC transporter permease [unclassified Streptomyces]KUJ36294.1 sugar ABC transporter permease [Streptomyces sp. NRRL F-5122]MDX3265813.1 carbohydrate ABC transporter permease [Streptomyces sp. MI02-2A]
MRPLAVTALGAVFAVPLYVVLANTFKPGADIASSPAALPAPPTLDNLQAVMDRPDHLFWASLTNSLLVTTLSVVVLTVLSAMLGHYLARTNSRWGRAATLLLLSGLMIPPQVILLPITHVLRIFHLMATVQGLVLFNVGYYVPFGVFVFAGFVRTIPVELEEAAAIDGAGRLTVFWRIVFPLLRPATASAVIFFGVWIWNDFIDPLIILGPGSGTTVTTGIYRAIGQYQADYGTVFGLMFLATLPVLILYLVLQKQFVQGLTSGATKG